LRMAAPKNLRGWWCHVELGRAFQCAGACPDAGWGKVVCERRPGVRRVVWREYRCARRGGEEGWPSCGVRLVVLLRSGWQWCWRWRQLYCWLAVSDRAATTAGRAATVLAVLLGMLLWQCCSRCCSRCCAILRATLLGCRAGLMTWISDGAAALSTGGVAADTVVSVMLVVVPAVALSLSTTVSVVPRARMVATAQGSLWQCCWRGWWQRHGSTGDKAADGEICDGEQRAEGPPWDSRCST
jgi:hypothetical protein